MNQFLIKKRVLKRSTAGDCNTYIMGFLILELSTNGGKWKNWQYFGKDIVFQTLGQGTDPFLPDFQDIVYKILRS